MEQPRSVISTSEIERKFLVKEIPFSLEGYPCVDIEQGYIDGTSNALHVRVRRISERYILTIKHGSGIERTEVELELGAVQAAALWPLTSGRRLTKTRYTVPLGMHKVELDVYRGRHTGLILCEVEFDSLESAERFDAPDWFGRDVTSDARYGNYYLACLQTAPDPIG